MVGVYDNFLDVWIKEASPGVSKGPEYGNEMTEDKSKMRFDLI